MDAVAFGPETHVAAEALQRSFRVKVGRERAAVAKAVRPPRPGGVEVGEYAQALGLEGYAAAAMAKINGLLDGARQARGGAGALPSAPQGEVQSRGPPQQASPALEMARRQKQVDAQRNNQHLHPHMNRKEANAPNARQPAMQPAGAMAGQGAAAHPPPAALASPALSPEAARKQRALEEQRRDLADARQAEEEVQRRRRLEDEVRDAQRHAERAALKARGAR